MAEVKGRERMKRRMPLYPPPSLRLHHHLHLRFFVLVFFIIIILFFLCFSFRGSVSRGPLSRTRAFECCG